ncbi:MAG: hypothetical protein II884_06675, partial [Synergistaceae bacterium]|nr:hypothetical protein [Synergistaceae bacterium]
DDSKTMLVISEAGIGKRIEYNEMMPHHRSTGGIKIMNLTNRTGKLAGCLAMNDSDELVIITSKGMVVRTPIKGIRLLGRSATGFIIIRLNEGDSVADCSIAKSSDSESESESESENADIPEDLSINFESETL